jgi:phosphate uptake regulator
VEIRKIQRTGGSTLVVSLPKAWCDNFRLKVGSKVMLNYNERGGVLIEPFDRSQSHSDVVLEITSASDKENDIRMLISKYIQGVKRIVIKSENRTMMDDVLRKFIDFTIGFEIIDERENEATIEDLISLPMLTFDKAIRRMETLVRSIVSESINPDKIPFDYILKKENEVDKFNIYIQRLFNQCLKDYSVLQLNKISSEEALSYLLLSRILERVADHGIRIYTLVDKGQQREVEVIDYVKEASGIFSRSMEYFFKKDTKNANEEISKKEYFKNQRENINKSIRKKADVMVLEEVMEDAERIALYSTDICELVVDYF